MEDETQATPPKTDRPKPWQFGLRELLLVPVVIAAFLGVFIGAYPFSTGALCPAIGVFFLAWLLDKSQKRGLQGRLAGALAIAFVIYAMFSFMASGVVDPREYARRSTCNNNLKQIMLALHNYHSQYGSFPPAYIADENGKPMHSWRVLILPFMAHRDLYDQYRFDEPWDGPNNLKLAATRIYEYECPEQDASGPPMTSYLAVVGPGTAWPGAKGTNFKDFPGGTSDKIMIVEVANSGISWMEPRDLDLATIAPGVNPAKGLGVSSLHREVSWSRRLLGAHVGMADGSTKFLPTGTSPDELRRMLLLRQPGGKRSGP
jgi:hypothetical protein